MAPARNERQTVLLDYRGSNSAHGYPRVKPISRWSNVGTISIACFLVMLAVLALNCLIDAVPGDFVATDLSGARIVFSVLLVVLLAPLGAFFGLLGLVVPGRVLRRGRAAIGLCLNSAVLLLVLIYLLNRA